MSIYFLYLPAFRSERNGFYVKHARIISHRSCPLPHPSLHGSRRPLARPSSRGNKSVPPKHRIVFCSSLALICIHLLSLSIIYLIAYLLIASPYMAVYACVCVCVHLSAHTCSFSLHDRSAFKVFDGNGLKSPNLLLLGVIADFGGRSPGENVTTPVKEREKLSCQK